MSRYYLPATVLIILLLAVPALALPTFTGSLSTPSGVTATAPWSDDFTISWEISQQADNSWQYKYLLTTAAGGALAKDPSHLIIEASDGVTLSDFWGIRMDTVDVSLISAVDTYSSANPSNPLMPGPMFGLKINTPNDFEGDFTYSFFTYRAPVWGDFYVKDGKEEQLDVVAWNTDFLMADPTAPAASGLLQDPTGRPIYKILRPDTQTSVVPEPTTLTLIGLGLLGLGAMRRKL